MLFARKCPIRLTLYEPYSQLEVGKFCAKLMRELSAVGFQLEDRNQKCPEWKSRLRISNT